jgi:hypothetical protein
MREVGKTEAVRTLGRSLARPMSEEEVALVSGADPLQDSVDPGTHGWEDHSPTGNPCADCD